MTRQRQEQQGGKGRGGGGGGARDAGKEEGDERTMCEGRHQSLCEHQPIPR